MVDLFRFLQAIQARKHNPEIIQRIRLLGDWGWAGLLPDLDRAAIVCSRLLVLFLEKIDAPKTNHRRGDALIIRPELLCLRQCGQEHCLGRAVIFRSVRLLSDVEIGLPKRLLRAERTGTAEKKRKQPAAKLPRLHGVADASGVEASSGGVGVGVGEYSSAKRTR